MKLATVTLLAGSFITATLLFSGCGTESATTLKKTPTDTTKVIRGIADNDTDWTWFVGTDATLSPTTATFTSYYMQGIPAEVKHFQYFLDTDNNATTGFSFGEDSWRISGADILVEDGAVYKSLSTTQWKWQYIGKLDHYDRSKVDGIEQINFSGSKELLNITAKTVNVTIEPFDAPWRSTYSTISTQAVHLVPVDDKSEITKVEASQLAERAYRENILKNQLYKVTAWTKWTHKESDSTWFVRLFVKH